MNYLNNIKQQKLNSLEFCCYLFQLPSRFIWPFSLENILFHANKERCRSACASAQSDQHLYYLPVREWFHLSSSYIRPFSLQNSLLHANNERCRSAWAQADQHLYYLPARKWFQIWRFLKFSFQKSILSPFDLVMQQTGTIWTFIEEGHIRIVPSTFGQNQGFQEPINRKVGVQILKK